jgi:hypothetical protein
MVRDGPAISLALDDNLDEHTRTCGRCISVPHSGSILPFYTRENKYQACWSYVFLGYFYLRGWPNHKPYYLFWCSRCDQFSVDCPYGEVRLYFVYHCCSNKVEINELSVYEKMGMSEEFVTFKSLVLCLKDWWNRTFKN